MRAKSQGQTAKRFGWQDVSSPEPPPQLTIQYNAPWIWTASKGNAAWSSSGNWTAGTGTSNHDTAILRGSSAETGGMIVSAGTLIIAAHDPLPDGTNLTVGESQEFGSLADSVALDVSSTAQAVAVPEPGSLLLLAIAALTRWAQS